MGVASTQKALSTFIVELRPSDLTFRTLVRCVTGLRTIVQVSDRLLEQDKSLEVRELPLAYKKPKS